MMQGGDASHATSTLPKDSIINNNHNNNNDSNNESIVNMNMNMSNHIGSLPTNDESTSNKKQHRNTVRIFISSAIVFLESLRLPKFLRGRDSGDGQPIIAGLERVLFGTQPAAEAVTILGVHPPRYLCYMISGFVCDLIQFGIDFMLHIILHIEDASVCWALGFAISVAFRHTSHRYLVFGDYVGGYWSSLGRMYAGYSIIIVLSTLFNIFMTRYAKLPHYVAWIVTLLWTGIVNYFILKKLWSFGGTGNSKPNQASKDIGDDEENIDLVSSNKEDHGPMRRTAHEERV